MSENIKLPTIDRLERGEAETPLITQSFLHSNDFESFTKHWKVTTYCPETIPTNWFSKFQKQPTTIFDSEKDKKSEFIRILQSTQSDSFKFVSFVLQHYKVWNDEEFLEEYGRKAIENFGNLPDFQIISENTNHLEPNRKHEIAQAKVENLFSYLMYDWFYPEPGQTYALSLKSEQFDEVHKKSLFKVLFDIVDDQKYKIYRNVVLRLLYQYLYELDMDYNLKIDGCFECIDELKELLLDVRDQELKVSGLKIVAVFWLISYTDDEMLEEFKANMPAFLHEDQIDFNDSMVHQNDFERVQTEDLIRQTKEASDFLELCFQLKSTDNSLLEFQKVFEKYLKVSEDYYGDYTHIGINHNIQLLSFFAAKERLYSTVNFIFKKFHYIGVNSTILTSFENIRDFTSFHVQKVKSPRLLEIEQQFRDVPAEDSFGKFRNFGTLLSSMSSEKAQSDSELKLWIFGRPLESPQVSIFERILGTNGTSSLLELIWEKFDLSTREEILSLKNFHGNYLIDYVIDSGDNESLLYFLKPKLETSCFKVPKVNLKFQNRQFSRKRLGSSLFQHFIKVCKICKQKQKPDDILFTPLRFRFFTILFSFLEETFKIKDIKGEVPIETLIELAKKPIKVNSSQFPSEIDSEHDFDNVKEEIDDVIGNIVAYWSKDDSNFDDIKQKLLSDVQIKPFYEILLSIVEEVDIEAFRPMFLENIAEVESMCSFRYLKRKKDERKTREEFLWVIILTAILNDRQDIIEFILTTESIANLKLSFPSNMRNNETTNFFAMKMLENEYELGHKNLPSQWITAQPFSEFLDKKLSYNKKNLIEVDCQFLLHSFTTKYQVRSSKDVDQRLLLWEDTKSLEYIYKDENLKEFITHPTVATYIDLKMHKFQSIYWWNFWLFALLFALPFGSLMMSYFCGSSRGWIFMFSIFSLITLTALVGREYFQLQVIDEHWKKYIRKGSNILEACLILVAIVTLITIFFDTSKECVVFIKLISVTMMLLFTFDLLATLRNASMPFYFIMLKTVAITFIKFFFAFLVILVAFTISFWVFFGVETKDQNDLKTTADNSTANGTNIDEHREGLIKNFLSLPESFIKIILMLSGEYSVEPFTLSAAELCLFFIFVIMTFILFNLIVGLTIDDVQKLKEDARKITLRQNVRSIIGTSSFCFKLYKKLVYYGKKDNKSIDPWFQQVLKPVEWFVTKQISGYYLLHKIDKFYVNLSTREVTFDVNRKQLKALTTDSKFLRLKESILSYFVDQSFVMEQEAFDRCKKILKISLNDEK